MPNEFVDLVVTSPPYDNLRTYNGYEFDFESIARELYRVMKKGGIVVWIVGDATINGSETGTSFKQALYFKEIGFNLHDTMIWIKDGGGAIGSNLCYTQNFEYMFVFSKGKPKSINLIYDKPNKSYGEQRLKKDSRGGIETNKGYFQVNAKEYSRRNNWWYMVQTQAEEGFKFHPAVFPEKLCTDHITSWSNEGDLVYDPFMGSGTTALAAKNLNRNSVGYEINPEFKKYYVQKVSSSLSFNGDSFSYEIDDSKWELNEKLNELPYLFKDPHDMNNKIDVKKLQFGSKIDEKRHEREEYYSITSILSPNTIILNNGVCVRLLGIKERTSTKEKAINFLTEKTKGKKVYMKYDEVKYDGDSNLLCYLYLDNKTFLNAHLLKNGLVDLDETYPFKYRNKFNNLLNC